MSEGNSVEYTAKETKDINKRLDYLYKSLGYSNEPVQTAPNNTEAVNMRKDFNLDEKDIMIAMKALTNSAAHHRSAQKSMMDARNANIIPPSNDPEPSLKKRFEDPEVLIQNRHAHMLEVASIAEYVAAALDKNKNLAKFIGLSHDIGHTWNGHSGERILSSIARLKSCGYIVHNAMGAYVLEREDIIEGAIIDQVKQMNPNVDEYELREFMRYVIDGIVSHNGEGVIGRIIPKDKTAIEMRNEIRKCFTTKGYDKKIVPASFEAGIIRFADIIAYTRSDIQDGFRLKLENGEPILKGFDDDYLNIIGLVLAKKNGFTKLLILDNKISLEIDKLTRNIDQLKAELMKTEDPTKQQEYDRTMKELEILRENYDELRDIKIGYAQKYVDSIEPDKQKIIIPEMMSNEFTKDLIEASKDKTYVTMSPVMRKALFDLRELNANKIVQYTKRKFEGDPLAKAALRLVDRFSEEIQASGIAFRLIEPELKEKYGLHREENKRNSFIQELRQDEYEDKMIKYYKRLEADKSENSKLREIYINTIEAIKDITEYDIAVAIGKEKYDGELINVYMKEKIIPIREKLAKMGKEEPYNLSAAEKEMLYNEILDERLANIEKMIANKMAIEYIGGMTDPTILSCLLSRNAIEHEEIVEGYKRPVDGNLKNDNGLKDLVKTFKKTSEMIRPDDVPDEDIRL